MYKQKTDNPLQKKIYYMCKNNQLTKEYIKNFDEELAVMQYGA